MARRVRKAVDEENLETINAAEGLRILRDLLHGKESDFLRLSTVPEDTTESQLETLKEQIVRLRGKIAQYEDKAASEAKEQADDPDGT
jgi:hypothetical protein